MRRLAAALNAPSCVREAAVRLFLQVCLVRSGMDGWWFCETILVLHCVCENILAGLGFELCLRVQVRFRFSE